MSDSDLDPIYDDEAVTKPRSYPRMGKKMKKIVKYIENQLGAPILEIELTPRDIKEEVEYAFDDLKHYMSDLYTVTIPYAQCIDVSKYNIDSVESVMRDRSSILSGIPYILPLTALNNSAGSTLDLSMYTQALENKKIMNTISTDMQFYYDKPNRKLFIVANPNPPANVTIHFKPEYYSIEDIREDYWETQLKRLALAQCKIRIGRIRSKYTANSAKYQLDGQTLLSEGNAEIESIRDYLNQNRDIFTVLN